MGRKPSPIMLAGLEEYSRPFHAIICDVWGVLHDGVAAFGTAIACLKKMRERGQAVALLSNAPVPHTRVMPQLDRLGISTECRDVVVTSGDLAQTYLAGAGPKGPLFHMSLPRDHILTQNIANEITTDLNRAEAILCSGLMENHEDDIAWHDPLLESAVARGLPFLCVNPDHVVKIGDRLIVCAGALAERYEKLGGKVRRFGKPAPEAYGEALRILHEKSGKTFSAEQTLVIGDSLATDIQGAALSGMTSVFVNSGIHQDELPDGDDINYPDWFAGRGGPIPDAVIDNVKW